MTLDAARIIAEMVAENPDEARRQYSDRDVSEAALVILVRNRMLFEPKYEITRVED